MIPLDFMKLVAGLATSVFGGFAVYLAQFTPKEAEGWLQLGGIGISLGGAFFAIRYLVRNNEKKDSAIAGMFARLDEIVKIADAKREEAREKMEIKWEKIRSEDIQQREADRATRERFSDSVESLARAVEGLKPKD